MKKFVMFFLCFISLFQSAYCETSSSNKMDISNSNNSLFTDEAITYEQNRLEQGNFGIHQNETPEWFRSDRKIALPSNLFQEVEDTLNSRIDSFNVPIEFIKLGQSLNKNKKLTEEQEKRFNIFFKPYSSYVMNDEQKQEFKDAFLVQELIDQYRKTGIKTVFDMFYNVDKLSTLSDEDFKSLDKLRDIYEIRYKIFAPTTFSRLYNLTDEHLKLDRQLADGKITPTQYKLSLIGIQRLYIREQDPEFWSDMLELFRLLAYSIEQNPRITITSILMTPFTETKSLQLFLAYSIGKKAYIDAQVEIALQKDNYKK